MLVLAFYSLIVCHICFLLSLFRLDVAICFFIVGIRYFGGAARLFVVVVVVVPLHRVLGCCNCFVHCWNLYFGGAARSYDWMLLMFVTFSSCCRCSFAPKLYLDAALAFFTVRIIFRWSGPKLWVDVTLFLVVVVPLHRNRT